MYNASIVARGLAYLASTCYSILIYFEDRGIYLHRNKDTRDVIYNKIKNHMKNDNSSSKLIVFWPEGTRLTYTKLNSVDDVKKNLKYGLLHLRTLKTPIIVISFCKYNCRSRIAQTNQLCQYHMTQRK
jgi:hypothetical protein